MQVFWTFLRRYFVFLTVSLVGMAVICAGLLLIQQQMRTASAEHLRVITQSKAGQLEDRLVQLQEVVLGLQAALTLHPQLDRAEFYNLLLQSNVMYRQPSLLAVGLARPVQLADLSQHINQVRADKRVAPLAFQNYTPGPIKTAQPLLLEHLYPINRLTEPLLGNNLAESDLLKEGLNAARDSGRLLVGPIFNLEVQTPRIFCLYAPIYHDLPVEPTIDERRTHHVGTIVAYVRLDDIVRPMNRMHDHEHLGWQLYDQDYSQASGSANHASKVIQSSSVQAGTINHRFSTLVHLPGRQWRIEFQSYDEVLSVQYQEWLSLAFGMAMLGLLLLAALIQFLYHSRQWALEMLLQAKGDESERNDQVQLLAQLMQESHDALVIRQPDGKIIYANQTAQQWFAPEDANLVGRFDVLLSSAEIGNLAHSLNFATRYSAPSGVAQQFEVLLHPLRNELLQTIALAMQVRDISLLSTEKALLVESNRRLEEMVDLSSDWFWEQDVEARFTVVTGGFFSRFDITPSYFIGKHRWDLGSGGLSPEEWDAHRAVLAARQAYRDFEYTAQLGREAVILSVSGVPFYSEDGEFMGYRGIGRDITGIRLAQKALISEQQRAQATLESIADGVITTDLFGRVEYVNPVASSLIGWDLAAAKGQSLIAIYQSVDRYTRLPLPDIVAEVLSDGGQYHGARRSVLLNKFGLNFQVEECAARIRDEQMRTIGAVLVFRDISNWREVDERVDFEI
ncbi:PAS domain-containing protein [Chitinibacter sp. SCUT-21]|uniref:PAS domain-containing protein n=1 Tax=Chitinibacter sp. SCUT-21 TaxID=2970891 RepID=UPI0035A59793